jgi:hypothetical protein
VFGVFEGRTPCHGIAHELAVTARPGCCKLKWRVTILQDPHSHEPTTYKVEGTLYGSGAREGRWRMTRGTADDPQATVYELFPSLEHRSILLLKGDDNVLFFLDPSRRPLIGTAQNTYTLDRRMSLRQLFTPVGARVVARGPDEQPARGAAMCRPDAPRATRGPGRMARGVCAEGDVDEAAGQAQERKGKRNVRWEKRSRAPKRRSSAEPRS